MNWIEKATQFVNNWNYKVQCLGNDVVFGRLEDERNGYITCDTSWKRFRGLMFSRKKKALFVFKEERNVTLHSFFVFYKLNVLFLDKDNRIVEIKEGLRPFSWYRANNKVKAFMELPLNKTEPFNHKTGDIYNLEGGK